MWRVIVILAAVVLLAPPPLAAADDALVITIESASVLRVAWPKTVGLPVAVSASASGQSTVVGVPVGGASTPAAILAGLTPSATYTVIVTGGIASRQLVTMPAEVLGRRNSLSSSSSWADVPWTTKGGNNLDRLPCLLDHVVLEGNLPVALQRVARMRSLTVASGGGLAFPTLGAYAVFPAPNAPFSNECGVLASTPEPVGPPVVVEAESASILRVSWEYDALAAPVRVTARLGRTTVTGVAARRGSVLLSGLTPGATYTVDVRGGITFNRLFSMPPKVMGVPGPSSSSWTKATWKRGNGDGLARLPCLLDNVVLEADVAITLDVMARVRSLTISGKGLAFQTVAAGLAFSPPDSPFSAECGAPTATSNTRTSTAATRTTTTKGPISISTTPRVTVGSEEGSSSSSSAALAGAGAAAGLLLLVIVILLIRRRRRVKLQVPATPDTTLGRCMDPEAGGWRPTPGEAFVHKNPVYVSGDGDNDADDTSGLDGIYLEMSAPSSQLASKPATEDPYSNLKHNLELLLTTVLAPLMRETQKQALTHLACPRPLRRTHLKLDKRLASGNFGEVWRGSFYDKRVEKLCDVAIKMVKNANTLARTQPKHFDAEVRGLQSEACLHAMLDCPFIVSLVGIAPAPDNQVASPWLVLELMSEGSLQGLLEKRHNDGTLTISDQLQWAGDAAEGLRFLHEKDILHRDVAARNVLATMDKNAGRICCKISDLGLSREIRGEAFKLDRPEATPSAWRAPETFQTRIFTKAGDVYSFGIFLWEVMSAVGSPFARQWTSHAELQRKIVNGARPNQPSKCPANVFDLMTECWVGDVGLRPPMDEVVTRLNRLWKLQSKAKTDAPAAPLRTTLPAVQAYMLNLDENSKVMQRNVGSGNTRVSALYDNASPAPDAEAGSRPHYDLACDSSGLPGPDPGDKRWAGRSADDDGRPPLPPRIGASRNADGAPPLPPRIAASRNANAHSNYKGSSTLYLEADRQPPGVALLQSSYVLPCSTNNDVDA